MNICPVCAWPLHSHNQLKMHIEVKHSDVQFVTVRPFGNQFKMQIHRSYPDGKHLHIGNFLRTHDHQSFVVLGQNIYAGEVDERKLSDDIADFLGLGKPIR